MYGAGELLRGQLTNLLDVHNTKENQQVCRGEDKAIQEQAFHHAVWNSGRHQHLHKLVKVMAYRPSNEQPETKTGNFNDCVHCTVHCNKLKKSIQVIWT